MTLTEPRSDLDRLRARRDAGRLVPHKVRPVSSAIEVGAAALYAAAMPRGATPWERHSHAFQGIYLERARTVLAAISVEELAQAIRTIDGDHTMGAGALAEALHAFLLGEPS